MGNRALVLVVEDDPDIRDIVTQVLAAEGYTVQTAEHGAAALQLIRQYTFGLILLDMQMPVMDGRAFLDAYRSRFAYHAPIVAMSASPEGLRWAKQLGATAQLAKPFDVDTLVSILEPQALHDPAASGSETPAGAPDTAADREA
jgi:CheY-like chemotaxis protein